MKDLNSTHGVFYHWSFLLFSSSVACKPPAKNSTIPDGTCLEITVSHGSNLGLGTTVWCAILIYSQGRLKGTIINLAETHSQYAEDRENVGISKGQSVIETIHTESHTKGIGVYYESVISIGKNTYQDYRLYHNRSRDICRLYSPTHIEDMYCKDSDHRLKMDHTMQHAVEATTRAP